MSSIKSFALSFVIMAVVLSSQITSITPIPMPPSSQGQQQQQQPPVGSPGSLESFINDQQQQQGSGSSSPNTLSTYNLLHSLKERLGVQAPTEDARLNYLRELIERLQLLEYQERMALQTNSLDYQENDVNDMMMGGGSQGPMKRSWDKMNGMWGKRASGGDNWNTFRGKYWRLWGRKERATCVIQIL